MFLVLVVMEGCTLGSRSALGVPVVAGAAGDAPPGVTWTEATITFSDLRLEEPPQATASWGLVQAAYAHPGHDYPGDVAGELLGTFTVDLLAPDVTLGTADCYTGAYATGRVALTGTAAVLAGDRDGAPFRFEIAADQEIVGIPFEVTLSGDAPPEAIALRFDPAAALSFTDWDAPETWQNTVTFGVVATPTWSLETVLHGTLEE